MQSLQLGPTTEEEPDPDLTAPSTMESVVAAKIQSKLPVLVGANAPPATTTGNRMNSPTNSPMNSPMTMQESIINSMNESIREARYTGSNSTLFWVRSLHEVYGFYL